MPDPQPVQPWSKILEVHGESLSPDEQQALQGLAQMLTAAINSAAHPSEFPIESSARTSSLSLSRSSQPELAKLLSKTLVQAMAVVHALQQQPTTAGYRDVLRQLELQLEAATVNSDVLLSSKTEPAARPSWSNQLRTLLLSEFDFVNRWLR